MTPTLTSLNEFINTTKEARELKRALAVKLRLENKPIKEIGQTLNVSPAYVTKWHTLFNQAGVASLGLKYQGSEGYLSADQQEEVFTWLRARPYWQLSALQDHLQQTYGVSYKSKQSYYALFKEAGISWKKNRPNASWQGSPTGRAKTG
jgi:putative transposase